MRDGSRLPPDPCSLRPCRRSRKPALRHRRRSGFPYRWLPASSSSPVRSQRKMALATASTPMAGNCPFPSYSWTPVAAINRPARPVRFPGAASVKRKAEMTQRGSSRPGCSSSALINARLQAGQAIFQAIFPDGSAPGAGSSSTLSQTIIHPTQLLERSVRLNVYDRQWTISKRSSAPPACVASRATLLGGNRPFQEVNDERDAWTRS